MSSNSMEQARYLMWAKRKQTSLSCNLEISQSNTSSYNDHDSWEEQAFAEDASGHLGGGCCIWPPRSYSCSFCRREFRSAQALGGHMNVHRRDRARLKQSPNPNNDQILNLTPPQNQISIQNPLHQYPISSQVCAFVYNANPNSDLGVINTSSPISPSTNNPRLLRSTISSSSSPQSWSNNMDQSSKFYQQDRHGDKKISKLMESRSKLKGDNCETSTHHDHNNLPALSLNLVLCNKEEAVIGFKRRKINPPSISSFSKVPSEVDTYNYTQLPPDQLFEVSPQNSIQELDLELRLGDRPKVKY